MDVIGPAISAVAGFFSTNFAGIQHTVESVMGAIGSVIQVAIDLIGGVIRAALQVISGDWSGVWETIKGTVASVWEGINGVINGAWEGIKGVMAMLYSALREPWEGLTAFVAGIWDGIKAWLLQGINSVISFMNQLIGGFNDSVGNITGKIELIPSVTSLAKGGIAKSPVMAMVGDAPASKGGEVIAPLTDLMGMIQQAIGGGGTTINVYGPFGPGYTPAQAGAQAADGYLNQLRARGVK